MVEPVDPFEDSELDSLQRAPGSSPTDDLSLEQPVDGFGQCIVIAIANAADRRVYACFSKAFRIVNGDILAGLKWSSQHLEGRSCDEEAQAAFGPVWSGAIVLSRSPGGGRTR